MQSINSQAPVTCTRRIQIKASANRVWSVLTNINNWPAWNQDISNIKISAAPDVGVSFGWKTGGATIQSTLHTVEPNRYFGWTGKTFGLFAIHNWTLTESEGITEVRVEESMQGLLASLFKKAFNRNLEKGMENWLQALKTECES